jgi:NAD(P)-dependent dehydrogenase (short-subunit alcohol dehydrogenase family)
MHTMIEDADLPPVVMPTCEIRKTLAGQKALVTGANSGIGKGVAIALGKAGAEVVVNYVAKPEQAEEVVAEIRNEGGTAYAHQADVAQEDQVQAMFERMFDQLGTVDILVNNAGLQRDAGLEEMTLKDWNTVIGVNLTGQFLCAREAVKEFKRRGMHPEVSCANFGPEQERLNNVFGARLRITALRAPDDPGVELLEYLAPRAGRPFPPDTRASDLWHWQINVATQAIDSLADNQDLRLVSSGAVRLPEKSLGFSTGLMARDPDGQAVLFIN